MRFIKRTYLLLLMMAPFAPLPAQMEIEWERTYGGSQADNLRAIQQTFDGGYIVGGYSASSDGDVSANKGLDDYWIAKLNAKGELEWEKNFGGTNLDRLTHIKQTNDGGYVLKGSTLSRNGDAINNSFISSSWVIKLDGVGNITWQNFYNKVGLGEIHQTTDNGYILTGSIALPKRRTDYWIAKLDSMGQLLWEKTYGGSEYDNSTSIQATPDGGYIVFGNSESDDGDAPVNMGFHDYWVIKLDAFGELLWDKNFGGSGIESARALATSSDGGFVLVGTTASNDGDVSQNNGPGGSQDFWIVKIDGSGNLIWERNFGGTDADEANDIDDTLDGGYIISGFSKSVDQDVGGNYGNSDFWIVKIDDSGNLEWEKNYGGSETDEARAIQQTTDGGFIIAGVTTSNDGDVTENKGSTDYWIVKLRPCPAFTTVDTVRCPGTSLPATDTLQTVGGCDSIITYNIIELPLAQVGEDFMLCEASSQLSATELGDTITGIWTTQTTGINFDGTNPNTEISELAAGENIFIWTISHAACPDYDRDTVVVTYLDLPAAEAGTDQTACQAETQLMASPPTTPISGIWTSVVSGISFADSALPTTDIQGLSPGTQQLIWTLSHPSCPDYDQDTVAINYLQLIDAQAGTEITSCTPDAQLNAQAPAAPVSGQWSSPSSAITFSGTSLADAEISGLRIGDNTLIWTLSHPTCPDYDRDTVLVTYLDLPAADAGGDLSVCQPHATLDALFLPLPVSGQWNSDPSGLSLSGASDPFAEVSGLMPGETYRLTWTLSHPNCPDYSQDEMTLIYDDSGLEAEDDLYHYNSGTLQVNVLANDVIPDPDFVEVRLIDDFFNPEVGNLELDAAGNLTFSLADSTNVFSRAFRYRVTHTNCPELTAEAIVTLDFTGSGEPASLRDISLVFTPDGDGINDVFIIPELLEQPEAYPNNSLVVINRWGEVVYRAEPYQNDWDGRHYKTGKVLPVGTYFFIARLHLADGIIQQGKATLVR